MSNQENMLIGRADFDGATNTLASFLFESVNHALENGINVRDLYGSTFTKANLETEVANVDPGLVVLGAHGLDDRQGGQNNEIVMQVGTNESIMQNRVLYCFSCLTARQLGSAVIGAGASAFLGYDEEFTWISGIGREEPNMDAGVQPIRSLSEGKTAGQAYQDSQSLFNDHIMLWEGSSDPIAADVISTLIWDRDAQRLLGSPSVGALTPSEGQGEYIGDGLAEGVGNMLPLVALAGGVILLLLFTQQK